MTTQDRVIRLLGGFAPITSLTFRGSTEKKAKDLQRNVFNVEEEQNLDQV